MKFARSAEKCNNVLDVNVRIEICCYKRMQLKRLNELVSPVLNMGSKKGRRSECGIEIFISVFTLCHKSVGFQQPDDLGMIAVC